MNVFPSTSVSRAPAARAMNSGEPPTDLKARTGLSTPPGMSCWARANRRLDFVTFMSLRRSFLCSADLQGLPWSRPEGLHYIQLETALGNRPRGLTRIVGDD